MVQTGIQLYSLRDVDDDVATVVERVADTDLDGVEFFRLDDSAVRDALDRTGVSVAGAHVGLADFESDFEATVDRWAAVGVEEFVVPWGEPEHFESREGVEAFADRLEAVAARLDERGYRLHYHNHDQEFAALDGETAFDVLAESAPSVRLELDLGWVGAAGHDPLAVAERYADRIDLLHVKGYDAAAGGPAKVGEGDLDLDAVAAFARENGVDWLIYEYEDGQDTYETLAHADEVMRSLLD